MSEKPCAPAAFQFPSRFLLDAGVAWAAFLVAYVLRFFLLSQIPVFSAPFGPPERYLLYGIIFCGILAVFLAFSGLYDRAPLFFSPRGNALAYFNAATFAVVGLMFITFTLKMLDPSRLVLGMGWLFAWWALWMKDGLLAPYYRRIRGSLYLLGGGEFLENLETQLRQDYANLQIRGFPSEIAEDEVFVQSLHDRPPLAVLYLLKPGPDPGGLRKLLALSQKLSFAVRIIPQFPGLIQPMVSFEELGGLPLITPRSLYASFSGQVFKRLTDYALGAALLILALPLYAVIGLLIAMQSPGPVFYVQKRLGRGGRVFGLWKFRTMLKDAEQMLKSNPELAAAFADKFKLESDPRITGIGRLLRKTSLDELPQLVNVLLGDISLVGPRPIVAEELPKYGEWADLFLSVKPGLTGLWQVSGRTDLPYEKRVELDVYYIENWSPLLDLKILFLTLPALATTRGAY